MENNIFNFLNDGGSVNNIISVIIIIVGILLGIKYFSDFIDKFKDLSDEEKIKVILRIVKAEILKLMSDAEVEWSSFEKAGIIKKSQVIGKIYEKYPVLSSYINQEMIICELEKIIEDNMNNMNSVINKK